MATPQHHSPPTQSGEPHALSTPFLGQPIEICIVTPDLRSTLDGLLKLGIGPFKIFKFRPSNITNQTFRGEPTSFSIDVAFAEQGPMIWEVMQPIDGPSIMQEYLDSTGGRGGIQHVAFDCAVNKPTGPLIREGAHREALRRREEFERRGFPLVQSGVWKGKSGTCEFMFFDTMGVVGTCFESYVFSDDWEEPEDVELYPPAAVSG